MLRPHQVGVRKFLSFIKNTIQDTCGKNVIFPSRKPPSALAGWGLGKEGRKEGSVAHESVADEKTLMGMQILLLRQHLRYCKTQVKRPKVTN